MQIRTQMRIQPEASTPSAIIFEVLALGLHRFPGCAGTPTRVQTPLEAHDACCLPDEWDACCGPGGNATCCNANMCGRC